MQTVLGVLALVALALLYVAPSLLAARCCPRELPRLLQLNVYWGWTVVVWVYCLVVSAGRGRRSIPAPAAAAMRPARIQHDRVPHWVQSLPRDDRTWSALPRDTAPLSLDDRTEER